MVPKTTKIFGSGTQTGVTGLRRPTSKGQGSKATEERTISRYGITEIIIQTIYIP